MANARRLRLTFRSDGFRDGDVPISTLANKLTALQNLLFHATATVCKDRVARRGAWQNRYREVAELTFANAHHSDLVIDVELPKTESSEVENNGLAAVDLVFHVAQAVEGTSSALAQLNLGKDDQSYLLRALEGLLPNVVDTYRVELENGEPSRHRKVIFSGRTRSQLRTLLQRDDALTSAEEATVVGELVKIHVGAGPEKISVRQRGIEIDCFYPESLRDQVANLMAGSIVEVSGWATLESEGRVKTIDSVIDVETVSMEPIRLTRFEHAGVRYNLRKPVVVSVDLTDGIWIYHSEAMNLWGYGTRREDALEDLHENFAYVWNQFAEEDDPLLDAKALAIKRLLIDVREVSAEPGEHYAEGSS